jgi:hypothetical protein
MELNGAGAESNRHDQLGKLPAHYGRRLQLAPLTRRYNILTSQCCLFG